MLPVTATVNPSNQSGAARLLEKLGFRNIASPGDEHCFRWDPGATQSEQEQ
jgi:hypothetical protein